VEIELFSYTYPCVVIPKKKEKKRNINNNLAIITPVRGHLEAS